MDRSSARCVSDRALGGGAWSTFRCHFSSRAAPMAKRPTGNVRSMGQARTAGARGRRCRCAASWSWPPCSEPVEDAPEPLALPFGRLAPDRAGSHVVDELLFLRPQLAAVSLAPQGNLVPGRRAIDVGEVRRAVVLVL